MDPRQTDTPALFLGPDVSGAPGSRGHSGAAQAEPAASRGLWGPGPIGAHCTDGVLGGLLLGYLQSKRRLLETGAIERQGGAAGRVLATHLSVIREVASSLRSVSPFVKGGRRAFSDSVSQYT